MEHAGYAARRMEARVSLDEHEPVGRVRQTIVIFLVSMAGLLLEVAYTRIVSYKLWYYYVYLVIGLALLGVGTGGIALATIRRVKAAGTEAILTGSCIAGAVFVPFGYLLIARLPLDTVQIWDYGSAGSFKNLAALGLVSFVLFASFIAVGLVVATILGRANGPVGGLYFGDLLGAGLGCLLAIPVIVWFGPPAVVYIAALLFALAVVASRRNVRSWPAAVGAVLTVALLVVVVAHDALPDVRPEQNKYDAAHALYSAWGPVFRVDVYPITRDNYLLAHDAALGSGIWAYNGNPASLTRFDIDPRRLPFDLLGTPPGHTLIVGSAGGNEILAALHFHSPRIEGVELNPVTVGILKHRFADYTGHLDQQPGVSIHQADARSFIARSTDKYQLVWFVAPDSYAANNAVSSGAFVLSESYLYTEEMIKQSLQHLTDNGIMVAEFGELDFQNRPNRTARYVVTARAALRAMGVRDPQNHIIVVRESGTAGSLPTVMVKRTAFTKAEVDRLSKAIPNKPVVVHPNGNTVTEDWTLLYAPGRAHGSHIVARLAAATSDKQLRGIEASYPLSISAVHDNQPFFWHFASFGSVLKHILQPIHSAGFDPENSIGERVLLLLLAISVLYAAVFLLLPFLFVRRSFAALPARTVSAVYFGALGLGFILFEVTMIQRLTRMLGYPTYSLTVTLAALLLATGIGALVSTRLERFGAALMPPLLLALGVLTAVYEFGLDPITDHVLSRSLGVRVIVALVVLLPLGFILGMFMPLGLAQTHRISPGSMHSAWAWAVNGFLSVIGSVLATILAMALGFKTVQWFALVVYVIAGVAFYRLSRQPAGGAVDTFDVTPVTPPLEPEPAPAQAV